jgi:hypothetical protein
MRRRKAIVSSEPPARTCLVMRCRRRPQVKVPTRTITRLSCVRQSGKRPIGGSSKALKVHLVGRYSNRVGPDTLPDNVRKS